MIHEEVRTKHLFHSKLLIYFSLSPIETIKFRPIDIGINNPFKDRIKFLWEEWIEKDEEIDLTKRNYLKTVKKEEFVIYDYDF